MKIDNQKSQIIIYKTEDGQTKIEVRFENETVWLTQKKIAELFNVDRTVITKHISNIFDSGELEENNNVQKMHIAQSTKPVSYYNLDVIISIGYRVNSFQATQFRIWATKTLKEYIVKGFVLDDERLKNPDLPYDYFEELTRRIADIRTSEKRFYRKITDIYATSVDYDPTDDQSILFFKTVQNKVHWAITGKTAAEIISERADSTKPHMGLTNWRGAKPRKNDTTIAKNYLNHEELAALNNLVEQYLIFAQGQAMRRVPMYMKDWISKLHGFLTLNDRAILDNAGKISHELAKELAEKEYDKYHKKTLAMPSTADKDFEAFANKATTLAARNKKKK